MKRLMFYVGAIFDLRIKTSNSNLVVFSVANPLRKQIYDIYGEEGLKTGVVTPTGFIQPYVFSNNSMKIYK